MSVTLDAYHDAVKNWLESNKDLAWLKEVLLYPEIEETLATPTALFAITGWERSDEDDGSGKLFIDLNCELMVVFSAEIEKPEQTIRNAVMALSLYIDKCRFGLPIRAATFLSAQPDALLLELDEYPTWSLQFVQTLEIGKVSDVLNAEVFNKPSKVMLGTAPNIGKGHEDDYETVYSESA